MADPIERILEGLENLMNHVDAVEVNAMAAEAFAQNSGAQYHLGRIVNMCRTFQNAYNHDYMGDIIEVESYLTRTAGEDDSHSSRYR